MSRTLLICTGCGREAAPGVALPFRCAGATGEDDVDHILARPGPPAGAIWPTDEDPNPFVRFRSLLYSWELARANGMSDADYVSLVRDLDAAVADIDGRGFTATPLTRGSSLESELGLGDGELWIKDETGNVGGSHKARHLMGIAISLAVADRIGRGATASPLAIASCGNAALAAAIVARAAGRPLRVAIPTWADPVVVARLVALGATLERCERSPDSPPGDPCYHRFGEWVADGALPFTVQGNQNGLAIEGGMTLGWELAAQLRATDATLDRLVIQVGGGALASSSIQALRWASDLGAIRDLPRIHAVQTAGAHPLADAWRRVAEGAKTRLANAGHAAPATDSDAVLAEWLRPHFASFEIRAELENAARHRSQYMRPVAEPAMSVATGILDDETYDWREVVHGMLETGGWPITVKEETLVRARDRAQEATGIVADATGTSGLAGVLTLSAEGAIASPERIGVLFTGAAR